LYQRQARRTGYNNSGAAALDQGPSKFGQNKMMRFLPLLLLTGLAGVQAAAQSTPPVDRNVVLKVSIASEQRQFRIGETIPLQLSFSSTVKNQYQVNMAQYDRSGRMNYEQFSVTPAAGAVDPLPTYTGGMGGLTNFKFLSTEPWTLRINLNEWLRFTQPGEYKLTVSSNRVGVRDQSNAWGTAAVTARSNEISLKIVAADPAWQKQTFNEAVAKLNAPRPGPDQIQQYETARTQALETLRSLGTADATRELAKRMRGEDPGRLDYLCMLGLISSPERSVARTALEEAIADPDHPVNSNLLYALRMVTDNAGAPNTDWRENSERILEQLVAALPSKRGKALAVSLNTAVSQAWDLKGLPEQTTEKLLGQLVAVFDELPLTDKNTLLSFRWNQIKSPALLPLLKRYAQSYRDFPEMRAEPAYNSLEFSGNALRRWYELDPSGAREGIITEITRPRPRYDTRVLGLLPDKTLPEVDFALAEHFLAGNDLDGQSNLASLIARYATDAILPQIVDKLDANIGKWACNIQNPILAYVLRVDPASARPHIEKAIAARGAGFSACNHDLFQIVSGIHYDPILEDIAIKSLDDPDPEVAMTAATMLGNFGSPEAEAALQQRYAKWSAQWRGREKDLDLLFADGVSDVVYQRGLGQDLVQALATGNGWLMDEAELRRLSQLSKVRAVEQRLEEYTKLTAGEPTIFVDSAPFQFHARVAQYEFQSLDTLKTKLAQFPSGTKFLLVTSGDSSGDQTVAEIRIFLSGHGMSMTGERHEQ
jgi:hypothetical protein